MIQQTQQQKPINQELFNKLKALIINNKAGFTANSKADILSINKGFAVSVTNNKAEDLNELVLNALELSKFFNNGFSFGGWYDEQNKNYYLDISFILEDKNQALQTAKNFNQLAIFDFSTFNSIAV